jgi:DNA primase
MHKKLETAHIAIDPAALGLETTGSSGQWVYVKCPFHDDSRSSAEFNMLSGVFYCFVCLETYSAEELAHELNGSIERVRDEKLLTNLFKEEFEWHTLLSAPLAINNEYLSMRGVTNEQIREFEIRETHDRVIFCSKDLRGVAKGVIIRRTDGGQPRYQKLGRVIDLWPAETLANSPKDVLIVEGIFGALHCRKAGFVAFAQLKGSPSTKTLQLLNGRRIIGFLDDDLAGYIGALKLLKAGARVVSPGGEADEEDHSVIERKIKAATTNSRFFVRRIKLEGRFKILQRLGFAKSAKRKRRLAAKAQFTKIPLGVYKASSMM